MFFVSVTFFKISYYTFILYYQTAIAKAFCECLQQILLNQKCLDGSLISAAMYITFIIATVQIMWRSQNCKAVEQSKLETITSDYSGLYSNHSKGD